MYQEENPADRLNALHKIETSQTTNEKVMNPPENVGQVCSLLFTFPGIISFSMAKQCMFFLTGNNFREEGE